MEKKLENSLFEKGKAAYADGRIRVIPNGITDELAKRGHDEFLIGGKAWLRGWDTACAAKLMEVK